MNSGIVKKLAEEAGFDLCGVTTPEIIPEAQERFFGWLKQGYHGEMDYLSRDPERRTDPSKVMPGVRSIIMLGLNYYTPNTKDTPSGCGRVSRYARGRDYHKVMAAKIKTLLKKITEHAEIPDDADFKSYIDYGPLPERPYAEKAGLGFIGKNGMLINKKFGSWIFLAEILTNLELAPDNRDPISHGHCGDCRLCLDACPTEAILSPRVIDSRLCISYLTIERPTNIPQELAAKFGDLLFGCDICQEVCPHNKLPLDTLEKEFKTEAGIGEFIDLSAVLELETEEDFLALTGGTPLTRTRLEGLQRNAEIARRNAETARRNAEIARRNAEIARRNQLSSE